MNNNEKTKYAKVILALGNLIELDEPAIAMGLLEGVYERLLIHLHDGLDNERITILSILRSMHVK